MQCAQCHYEVPEGGAFCPQCGSPLADAPAVAAETPSEAPPPEALAAPADAEAAAPDPAPSDIPSEAPADALEHPEAEAQTAPAGADAAALDFAPTRMAEEPPAGKPAYRPAAAEVPKKKRKRHGCLISFGVFLLLIGIALAVVFDLPMRLGLISSPAEKLFTEPADIGARAVLTQEFEQAGQPAQGISFYVLPYKDRGYSLAYVVLDQSKGYRYVDTGFGNPIFATFELVARSKAVEQAQIYRVAVEFREADGSTLCVLTAPVFAIQQYAAKTITKKQLYMLMDGHGNLAKMFKDQYMLMGSAQ
jgi:hypothetical protein